jgi:signal transduction histidine kinase/CheY-like chemotaxis protein
MSEEVITFLIELPFVAVFIGALVTFVRKRDPLALDVALVFSALTLIFIIQAAAAANLGTPPAAVNAVAILLLLAQPVFTLKLVSDVRALPGIVLPLATLGFAVTGVPFAVAVMSGTTTGLPTGLLLLAIGVFVASEGLAAAYLWLEARRRVGSARFRLGIAAIATAIFAVALLSSGAGSAGGSGGNSGAATAPQLLALIAAISYVVAFLPPRWLRRLWQATAAYDYGQQLLAAAPTESQAELWGRLALAATAIGGAHTAAIVATDAAGVTRVLIAIGQDAAAMSTLEASLEDRADGVANPQSRETLTGHGPGLAGLVRIDQGGQGPLATAIRAATGADFAASVALGGVDSGPGYLVILSNRASLFAADDLSLLGVLGRQTALLVDRRAVLTDQEQLTERLSTAVTALEAAGRAKSDFLASMSHELRTPLNAVIGFSDLMRTEPHHGDSVTVPSEWVEHIHRSGQHLLGLINDVLDLAKVEAGRLDLSVERLDLATAVIESVAGLRPLADRKGISVETTIPPIVVEVDRGRLRQIVYNLLSNAIKYTPEDGRIAIEAVTTNDEVRLAVVDSGVGIAAADLGIVFEEFRQVGDPAARQPGTGLGLALTKRLVEAHGGRIELESTPGKGSRFTVILPAVNELTDAAIEPPPGPVSAHRPADPLDVLVIEDEPSGVRLLRTYLESDGYRVRVASDGERGVEEARRSPPAAIILDLLLPGMDGWDVLRQLKSDDATSDIPVIIVTVVDEREVGLALGAVDYLVKPVERALLLEVVRRFATGKASPFRVLAIDDDPAALDVIDAALRPAGYDVIRAAGGREGVDIAMTGIADFVICDILMPDLDGFGVVTELRADARTHDLPILVLTNHELTGAEKTRLNGQILGVVAKGESGHSGLRDWLAQIRDAPANPPWGNGG